MPKRVRTGCLTCRKRRVKCDERRPICDRCHSANFECEGYEAPRKTTQPTCISRRQSPSSHESSSSPEASSPEMISEMPWRQSNWRPDQLPLYHHFVTSTVVRLFRADHVNFWRDQVAQMSFEIETVYEALLAVGAAHRASLLPCSGDNIKEIRRCKVLGLGAYGRALRLLATNMNRDTTTDPWPVLIVLLLCTYFECFMGNSKSALRHLWAAIQVLRKSEARLSPVDLTKMVPVYEVILRLDFLALKLFPYSASSFSQCSDLALMELPFWNREPSKFFSITRSDSIANERHRLIQIICGHNKLSRVVWGGWYPISERPSRDELMGFYNELLLWKATSPATLESCPDLDVVYASSITEFETLPMPPLPLRFTSSEAAVNIIMFNGYLGCALAMITTTDENPVVREIETFNLAYQNLCIAAGLIYQDIKQTPTDYKPCDSLDNGISGFLYFGTRRCFSRGWQQWTIDALRSIGIEGLSNAYALANTLEIGFTLEKTSPNDPWFERGIALEASPLGLTRDRLIPLLMPCDDDDPFSAYYLRYGFTDADSDERVVRVAGRASWKQDESGNVKSLDVEAFDIGDPRSIFSLDESDSSSILSTFRRSVEGGWHGVFSI